MAAHATKKLINSVDACVDQSLEGLVATQPGLQLLHGHRVVIRGDIEEVRAAGKVTLLSGGGSGHEPAHAGFVGRGMLTGAIAGSVFTSPPPHSILAAIRAVGKNNPAGTLLIVKNYTGDRLNFGLAAERATAEGLRVDMVVISDDCALTSNDKTAGRRGLCGTILIHKIAGAMAEAGKSLEEIVYTVRSAAESMESKGVSVQRAYCGTLMTSLEMAGVSLTIMHLDSDGIRARCLDQDTTAPAWPRVSVSGSSGLELNQLPPVHADEDETAVAASKGIQPSVSEVEFKAVKAALSAACDILASSEDSLNELDRGSGDGDCGTTIKSGVQGVTSWLAQLSHPVSSSSIALKLSSIAETNMGGSSGALYSLFFTAVATVLDSDTSPAGWVNALKCGMDAISKYGGASVGDRTMLDAMQAAFLILHEAQGEVTVQVIKQAAEACLAAAEATATMDAKAGRASYVSRDQLTRPDPGAMAVAIWMTAVANAFSQHNL